MKKLTLTLALAVALTSQQNLMANSVDDWLKGLSLKGQVALFFGIVAGGCVLIAGGGRLLGEFINWMSYPTVPSPDAQAFQRLIYNIDNSSLQSVAYSLTEAQLETMKDDLANGIVPSVDKIGLNPEQMEQVKNETLQLAEYQNGITNPIDIANYESIVKGPKTTSFDDFVNSMKMVNTRLLSLKTSGANISDALQTIKAETQTAGNLPDLPQTGPASPTDPATGTGSSVQTPAAGASFEALQSNITQSIANISKLTPADLTNLRATITQQMATAQAELKSAVTEEQRVAAQEKVDTATDNAKNFNDNKPTGSDVPDVDVVVA